jgi:DNA (cytosine-5)-methyltransferase 1
VTAYYNEHDAFAAAWLRELIADGLIAPGEVDERSIEDVRPDELAGFVQCHFFAGIGIWSLALRRAGWPDAAPIWTGSCPCQPFSTAGKGAGFADERHLWPAFHWLIEQCAPELVLGEQVASKDGLAWLDLVSVDLEAAGYAFGAADTCAAGFGAPHIRQRLYWMADANHAGLEGRLAQPERAGERPAGPGSVADGLADADGGVRCAQQRPESQVPEGTRSVAPLGVPAGQFRPGPLNGLWRTADWLCCTDGKWRPVAPGTFPLAPARSLRNRVGLLRGAGNAINLAQAQGFIEAVIAARSVAERLAA